MGILFEKKNHIAYITLNNPAKANILDRETSHQISDAWKEIWEDRDVRVAILTGAGDRHFCAGHNLAPRPGVTQEDRDRMRILQFNATDAPLGLLVVDPDLRARVVVGVLLTLTLYAYAQG